MARPYLCILVEKGPKNGHSFRCDPPASATVGRDRSNSLQITKDSGISQRHLCFRYIEDGEERESSGWVVEDKGSSNGTLLNGTDIRPGKAVAIKTGDIIKIGAQTTIRVEVLPPLLHLDKQDRKTRKPVHEDQQEEGKRKHHGKKASAGNKKSSKIPLCEIQEAVVAEDKESEEHEEEEEAEDEDREGDRQKQCKKASDNKRETCKNSLLEKQKNVAEDDGKENQMEKGAMKTSNDKKKTVSKPKLQEAVTIVEEKQNENQNKKHGKKASSRKKKTKTCDSPLLKVQEDVVENHEEDQRQKEVKRACVNKKKSYKKPPLEMQDKEEEEVPKLAHCEKPILVLHEKSEAKAAAAAAAEEEEEEEEEAGGGGGGGEGRDQGQTCGKNDLVDEVGSMTVLAWFDHMMEEGPKYLYRVSESIIQDMKAEAEKFDEYIQSL